MNWRGLHISEPAGLSIRDAQLVVESGEQKHRLPVEDLAFIILDTQQVRLTGAVLSRCAEKGCLIVTSNGKHLPNGILTPFGSFHRQAETLLAQIGMSEPRRKRLWQKIVKQKIINQATCLTRLHGPSEEAEKIRSLARKVKSGDGGNVEALAAREYWAEWHGEFSREQEADDRLNLMLNYAYALIRSVLCRELAGYGFAPALGLHHRSMTNAFNLTDDLMEPWRPFVDEMVFQRSQECDGEFCIEDRRALARIFLKQISLDSMEFTVLDGMRFQVEQFHAFVLGGRNDIPFPTFI